MSLPLRAFQALFVGTVLLCGGCASRSGPADEEEAVYVAAEIPAVEDDEVPAPVADATADDAEDGEVPIVVAETEHPEPAPSADQLAEVVVGARVRDRHEAIHDLVTEAQTLLRNVDLTYAFTGKGKREVLRGRPVAFALWSDVKMEWTVAHIEIPRPPVKWRPGRRPLPFTVRTPGIEAQHVKGTGAERLMFSFTKGGEQMKVYGRKFPVFDSALLKKKQWRAVAQTAQPIVYLPFTEDTLDPLFVTGGKDYLLSTARRAITELRAANAPSRAYPGELLADVVPAEVITTLAVIEQTDDSDFVEDPTGAVEEVLSHYGLKLGEAYRYSVSSAAAIGAMQFTNRRGNGTYALVVRRCPEAKLDRNFERGATDILNAMKAAICLFDIELAQMREDIRDAYHDNKQVLGIFPVAAYNGGPRNVGKLYKVMNRMGMKLEELRPPGEQPVGRPVPCPCLWKAEETGVRPISIPSYNRENRGYIEKYQTILKVFE
ncbi:MAG: hypothetical protein ABI859_17480 [Pseudomonadota bacterium]